MTMQVKIKRTKPNAVIPTYGTPNSACFDLTATDCIGGVYGTGLAFEFPEDHVMLVFSRSGHGFNHGIRLANCVGVIDSDYRAEVKVKLIKDGYSDFNLKAGDRVAQAMIIPVQQVEFIEGELSTTERGEGGFGSTGN